MSSRVTWYVIDVYISVSFTRTIDVTVFCIVYKCVQCSHVALFTHNDEKIKAVDDKNTEKLTVRVDEALYFCHVRNSLFNSFGHWGILLKGYLQLYFLAS